MRSARCSVCDRALAPCGGGLVSAAHVAGPTRPSAVRPRALLEALDRALGGRAEDAVGGQVQRALDLRDARAVHALLQDARGRARGQGEDDQQDCGSTAHRAPV